MFPKKQNRLTNIKTKLKPELKRKKTKEKKKIKQSKQTHETKNQSGGEPTISSQQQQQEPAKDTASTETMIQPELQSGQPQLPPGADPQQLQRAKLHYQRTLVAQEILDTEESYLRYLTLMIKKYQNPLLTMAQTKHPLISAEDVKTLFSNVEIIFAYNSMLLEGLKSRMNSWSSQQKIGDVFLSMADFLKCYTTYVNNYDEAHLLLRNLVKENPKFAKFIEEVRSHPHSKGLNLFSLLIMPIQRPPRYVLLLKELQKFTPQDHPDYVPLAQALKKIESVSSYLNTRKREQIFQHQLVEAMSKVFGAPVVRFLQITCLLCVAQFIACVSGTCITASSTFTRSQNFLCRKRSICSYT